LTELTPAQLKELADAIANRLADESRPLDYQSLSKWLGVSVPKLEQMKRSGQIPFIQAGRRVLFDRLAVVKALSQVTR
jgi:excisionase family DNA binding protein